MAEITLGTLYDANKQILKTVKPHSEKRIAKDLTGVGAWMSHTCHPLRKPCFDGYWSQILAT